VSAQPLSVFLLLCYKRLSLPRYSVMGFQNSNVLIPRHANRRPFLEITDRFLPDFTKPFLPPSGIPPFSFLQLLDTDCWAQVLGTGCSWAGLCLRTTVKPLPCLVLFFHLISSLFPLSNPLSRWPDFLSSSFRRHLSLTDFKAVSTLPGMFFTFYGTPGP